MAALVHVRNSREPPGGNEQPTCTATSTPPAQRSVQRKWQAECEDMDEDALNDEEEDLLSEIRTRRKQIVQQHRQKKALHSGISVMPRSKHHSQNISDMKSGLESMGMDAERAVTRARSADTARIGRKRERSCVPRESSVAHLAMEDEAAGKRMHSSRSRSMSRGVAAARCHCDTFLPTVMVPELLRC